MPSSVLQHALKKASTFQSNNHNTTHPNRTTFEYWSPRKFPLDDEEFESMLSEDQQTLQNKHRSKKPNTKMTQKSFFYSNNKYNSQHATADSNQDGNDHIDALMQIES